MGTQITALDTALLRVPTGTQWTGFGVTTLEVVNVTLTDDDGATGTGFTFSVSGGAAAMRSLVEGLIGQATVGSELEGWERRWHGLWARTHRLGRGVAVPALSAVDIAVWDLRARRAGLPLYRLLGAYRDQVPAYRSLDRMAGMSLPELVEAAIAHVGEGGRQIRGVLPNLGRAAPGATPGLGRRGPPARAAWPWDLMVIRGAGTLPSALSLRLPRDLHLCDVLIRRRPMVPKHLHREGARPQRQKRGLTKANEQPQPRYRRIQAEV